MIKWISLGRRYIHSAWLIKEYQYGCYVAIALAKCSLGVELWLVVTCLAHYSFRESTACLNDISIIHFVEMQVFPPLPWASVHWLVQCTLGCHWNATGWPSVYQWDNTGRPREYLQGTLEHHWKKNSWNSPTLECHWRNLVKTTQYWDATGETLTLQLTLEHHWRECNGPHTPGTYS